MKTKKQKVGCIQLEYFGLKRLIFHLIGVPSTHVLNTAHTKTYPNDPANLIALAQFGTTNLIWPINLQFHRLLGRAISQKSVSQINARPMQTYMYNKHGMAPMM